MNGPDLHAVIEALGWTLVHFLWQGALIGIVFGFAMRLTAGAGGWLRYRVALALLAVAGMAPVVTFWMLLETAGTGAVPLGGAVVAAQAAGAPAGAGASWLVALERALEPHLAWAVAFWLAGVIVMSGRVCLDWWQVRRLTWVGVEPLPASWDDRVTRLVRTFGVSRPVRVVRSTIVRVPAVIGWLRPVVLIPTAALAGLSPRQLELIIAHELAHIRRADYLVNLLQVIIETVLFYHPAVRWMSNRVRQERELCCDDAVIANCGDTLTYAQALTELEAQRQAGFRTALAANGGHLSQRIHRMLDRPRPRRNALVWSMSLVVGLAAGSMALAAQVALTGAAPEFEPPALAASNDPVGKPEPAVTAAEPAQTTAEAAAPETGSGPRESAGLREPAEPRTTAPSVAAAGADPSAGPGPLETARNTGESPADDVPAPAQPGRSEPAAGDDATGDRPDPVPAPGTAFTKPEPANAPAREATRVASARQTGDEIPETDAVPPGDADPRNAESPANPAPATSEPAGDGPPTRLARATPAAGKATEPALPEVRGGEPLQVTAPEYPRHARMRGLQGSVAAEFTIGRDGRIRDIQVTDSSPAGVFDRAVLEALEEWRFRPMTRDGERVTRRVSKVFEFNLSGSGDPTTVASSDECDPVTGTRICRN